MRAIVARWKLGGDLALTKSLQLLGGFEGAICGSVGEKDFYVLAVDLSALGLAIRAKRAADVGTLVPGEAEPAEGVEYLLLGGSDEAGAVGVFNAEDKLAATLAGVDVVDQADVGCADVWVAGGAGGDADADRSFGIVDAIRHMGQTLMLAEGRAVRR